MCSPMIFGDVTLIQDLSIVPFYSLFCSVVWDHYLLFSFIFENILVSTTILMLPFVRTCKERYWIRFFTIAISFITWKSRLWLAYCHFIFTLFFTDFHGCAAWKFTIDMLKSYSLSKYIVQIWANMSLLFELQRFIVQNQRSSLLK